MARVTLTKQTPVGPYPTLPVAANSLDVTFTAADTTNFEQFLADGKNLVLVRNTHATNPGTVTFTSSADPQGRTGDITTYSLGAGEVMAFLFKRPGWMQSDLYIYMQASATTMQYAVLTGF